MRVLELGSYVAPAFAGMLLAEQGYEVVKWTNGRDPVLALRNGAELWSWLNEGKHVELRDIETVDVLDDQSFDLVLDNVRAATWAKWGIDPADEARRLGVTWVSLRADDDGRSFDVIAQARAWGDIAPPLPFYLGDTSAGLWLAFKLLAASRGHHVIRQAAVLAKLVEGELVVDRGRDPYPFDDPHEYGCDDAGAFVVFKGERYVEPLRDAAWRREHLAHVDGRYRV